jgi:hypothetical protein
MLISEDNQSKFRGIYAAESLKIGLLGSDPCAIIRKKLWWTFEPCYIPYIMPYMGLSKKQKIIALIPYTKLVLFIFNNQPTRPY